MIILDPFWDIETTLKDHDGHVPHTAIMSVPEKLGYSDLADDEDHPLSKLQPSVEHALVCIVLGTAGDQAAVYVNDFLTEFSPLFAIPRLQEFP